MNKKFLSQVIALSYVSSMAFAQTAPASTSSTTNSPSVYTPPSNMTSGSLGAPQTNIGPSANSISTQAAGLNTTESTNQKQKNEGIILTIAGAAVATYYGVQAAGDCSAPPYAKCPWDLAKVAAGVAVALYGGNLTSNATTLETQGNATVGATQVGAALPFQGTPTQTGQALSPQLQQAVSLLNSKGYGVNPLTGTVTTPSGATISGASVASGDTSGLGLSPADAAKLNGQMASSIKDAQSKLATDAAAGDKSASVAAAGADSALDGSGSGLGSADVAGKNGAGGAGSGKARNLAAISGAKLSVNNGADALGVANGDIFQTVKTRYQLQSTAGKIGF